jgi:hypothetical protein
MGFIGPKSRLHLSPKQLRELWQLKHTLSLVSLEDSEMTVEKLTRWVAIVKVTTEKLQAILYDIPNSSKYNPYREDCVVVGDNEDIGALK